MSSKSASDNCRLCGVSFKIQFGNLPKQSHSSSENIFKPSKRKECFGVVLSEIVRQVGFSLVQDSSRFSDRVCNPCGRKIRNLGQLYHAQLQRRLHQWKLAKETLTRQIKLVHRGGNQNLYVFVPWLARLHWGKFLLSYDHEMLSHMNVLTLDCPLVINFTLPSLPLPLKSKMVAIIFIMKLLSQNYACSTD